MVEAVRLTDVYSSDVVDALQAQHKSDRNSAEELAKNPLISANVLLRLGKVRRSHRWFGCHNEGRRKVRY